MYARQSLPKALAIGLALLVLAEQRAGAGDLDILLFESLDAGAATFSTGGAKIGLDSLDKAGPLGLASIGEGVRTERHRCGCGLSWTFLRVSADASAQLGYQWTMPEGVVAAFGGFESSYEGGRHPRNGLRLQGEVWLRPSEDTLVQGVLIAGISRGSAWTRLAWGYRLWETYIGPEGSAYLDATGYWKAAVGIHATDFILMDVHVRLSTGMQWETRRAWPTPYVSLTTWSPF